MVKVGSIILAAGLSKRMRKPKLLMDFHGEPVISYPVRLATKQYLYPIILVAGQYIQQMKERLSSYENITYIYNSQFELGMSTSLKLGIQSIAKDVDGVLIFLGDQPCLTNEVIESILMEFKANRGAGIKIVRPRYAGKEGHPILFHKDLFHEFQLLEGDEGGKSILKKYKDAIQYIDFSIDYWGSDIDTEEDYRNLLHQRK